jgi:hypothetical protein
MIQTMTGGCQCGRVRYTVQADPLEASLCHCKMCQKATGGVAGVFAEVQQADVIWHSEPDWYDSSPVAQRPFCSRCGSPLGYRWREGSTKIGLTVGSFDDSSVFRPKYHFGVESLREAWIDTSALPRHRAADYDVLVEKWQAAGREMPE